MNYTDLNAPQILLNVESSERNNLLSIAYSDIEISYLVI